MRILVADDSPVARRLLQEHLSRWGYEVDVAQDGAEAWALLQERTDVHLAIVDWDMPRLDGLALCRRVREHDPARNLYLVMCTARDGVHDTVEGLDAGADDYLTKPLDRGELRARLQAGVRTVNLKLALQERVTELESALDHIQRLEGLLPICMHCKCIRNENQVWQRLEQYVEDRADVSFSHGLCGPCLEKHYPETVG